VRGVPDVPDPPRARAANAADTAAVPHRPLQDQDTHTDSTDGAVDPAALNATSFDPTFDAALDPAVDTSFDPTFDASLDAAVESARDPTFNATHDSTVDAAHDRAVDATHADADTDADRSAGGRRLAGARGGGTAALDGDRS
jgi:hypothetical protein